MRLAEVETYRPLWSADVLTELRSNLIDEGIDADKVDYRIGEMRPSFPDASVTGYESLIDVAAEDLPTHGDLVKQRPGSRGTTSSPSPSPIGTFRTASAEPNRWLRGGRLSATRSAGFVHR